MANRRLKSSPETELLIESMQKLIEYIYTFLYISHMNENQLHQEEIF